LAIGSGRYVNQGLSPFDFGGPLSFAIFRESHCCRCPTGTCNFDRHNLQTKPRSLEARRCCGGGISVGVGECENGRSENFFFRFVNKIKMQQKLVTRASTRLPHNLPMSENEDTNSHAGFDAADHQVCVIIPMEK
jgi:hypothetical protein